MRGETSAVRVSEAVARNERQRLPLGEGGFPSVGNWRTRRGSPPSEEWRWALPTLPLLRRCKISFKKASLIELQL